MPRLALALLASLLAGCGPFEPDCTYHHIFFGSRADNETVAQMGPLDCTTGDIFVEDTEMSRFEMSWLTLVQGNLVISQNLLLREVSLPRLEEVGTTLDISFNGQLVDVSLPELTRVGGDVYVRGNRGIDEDELAALFEGVEIGGQLFVGEPAPAPE